LSGSLLVSRHSVVLPEGHTIIGGSQRVPQAPLMHI
jgi:hypothetical protein